MVFNWFRRKFGGSGEEPSPPAETPTAAPSAESKESTESTASPGILNWAKTALQSIQARQQSESAATIETPEETQETPPAEPVAAEAPAPVSVESEKVAVAESAPVQPVVEAEPVEPASSLVLDEGFLWSAEVLAAQGRRPEEVDIEEITWLQRLRQGLGKTRRGLVHQLRAIVGQGPLSRDAVEEIEMLLLQSDVGVKATDQIIAALQTKIRQETLPADRAIAYLKEILREILDRPFQEGYRRDFAPKKGVLNIWLIAGVNGVGKTTTIGKLAHIATQSGYRCLIAAADTFRAAATEQVKIWGQRSGVEVIANPGKNTDPAAVVFDAIGAAQARGTELLLVDTAGRLQNKANLMEELKKIRRIIDKKAGDAQIESLLVLDATLGQNGLRQAQVFAEAAQLTGVILTKLDSTAKGGVALAVVQELGLPIRFIGAGEGIKDLRPFCSFEFVEALLSSEVEVAA
ncbi:signal recognition particle-docking protein FtsY [Thermosynechococcus sp. HN-54]|uniref:signal recognition particle-docking protein FtsY n=1 Tax=Thermosynechococcus sp. HN-54 TaxID=2933959 RepID=UPI00202CC269|nr:signal recognition particle-docking protein FtsY [Thermosynechococcus sp. HN-54]URR34792.1 signal recognition particle-docking protein FtsY [Thermosynechococcus sp. HN-54]